MRKASWRCLRRLSRVPLALLTKGWSEVDGLELWPRDLYSTLGNGSLDGPAPSVDLLLIALRASLPLIIDLGVGGVVGMTALIDGAMEEIDHG